MSVALVNDTNDSQPALVSGSALVRITNGLLKGNQVTGVFEFIKHTKDAFGMHITVKTSDNNNVIITLPANGSGRVERIKIGEALNFNEPRTVNTKLTEAEVSQIIEERFEVLDGLLDTMIDSELRSILVSGAPGIGKTFNLETKLEEYERTRGQYWGTMGGSCSPFGLYETLYEYRHEGSILVMDDVEVFDDDVKLNLLKKALDSNKRRVVSWKSASRALDNSGLPSEFEFKGKVAFLTNINIFDEIQRGTRRAPHLKALVSRSCVLDLGIHDVRTILLHVKSVTRKTNMLVARGLTEEQQEDALNWLHNNQHRIAELSLRTPLHIAEYIKTNPSRWEIMCNHTLLRAEPLVF